MLLLSACGGTGEQAPAVAGTQIHANNMLDVYAIARNEVEQSRHIEQLWRSTAQQLLQNETLPGSHRCAKGGQFSYERSGPIRTLHFKQCDTGLWLLASGSLSMHMALPEGLQWQMQARQLSIKLSRSSERPSLITADITQRPDSQGQAIVRSGSYTVAYKGRVDSVSMSASYSSGAPQEQLLSYSLNIFPPRFSQQLSVLQLPSEPDALMIKSVGDSSAVIGRPMPGGLELAWLTGDGSKEIRTASVASLDAAYRRVD